MLGEIVLGGCLFVSIFVAMMDPRWMIWSISRLFHSFIELSKLNEQIWIDG